MSQRSIEVKVGALILVALGLLGAFIVIMGGLSFEPTYTVYVGFQNPGGLAAGAPVRISGVKVGRVESLEFRGGRFDPQTRKPEPLIRAVVKLERKYREAVRQNSRWLVTSQGVLGEMFLAIEPGSHDQPLLENGAVVQGISPPRLDLLLSESYELLHQAYLAITGNEQKIAETFDGLHRTLRASASLLERNEQKLDALVNHTEQLSREAREALGATRQRYVDGPQVTRIFNDLERTSSLIRQNAEPLLRDSRDLLADGKKLTAALSTDDQLERYRTLTQDLSRAAGQATRAAAGAEAVVEQVRQGKGTLGALVMDEAVYDDLQEMLRDLKHNPWKFFWRQ